MHDFGRTTARDGQEVAQLDSKRWTRTFVRKVSVTFTMNRASPSPSKHDQRYKLPPLGYAYDALAPHYSAELLELHYGSHHQAYVDGLNKTLEALTEIRSSGDFAPINQLREATSRSITRAISCIPSSGATSSRTRGLLRQASSNPVSRLPSAARMRFGGSLRRGRLAAGFGLGRADLGNDPGHAPDRADPRPPGPQRHRHGPAPRHGHVGARVLPPVQEQEREVDRQLLGDGELGRDVARRLENAVCVDLALQPESSMSVGARLRRVGVLDPTVPTRPQEAVSPPMPTQLPALHPG